jgi:hypothetical protein
MPNLHDTLRCDADILQLDVIAVGEVASQCGAAAEAAAAPVAAGADGTAVIE